MKYIPEIWSDETLKTLHDGDVLKAMLGEPPPSTWRSRLRFRVWKLRYALAERIIRLGDWVNGG